MNAVFGLLGMAWVAWYFFVKGGTLTLDAFNFAALFIGILLHPNTASFFKAAAEGGKTALGYRRAVSILCRHVWHHQVIRADRVTGQRPGSVATQHTYPAIVYWYSGIVNYFVPSGGSKWAIEAPYIMEAAKTLGVSAPKSVVAYAWGDMATDLIQPFWALPLLSVAKLDFKDIMGYEIMIFILTRSL